MLPDSPTIKSTILKPGALVGTALACLSCGSRTHPFMGDAKQSISRTYGRIVGLLAQAIELKRLTIPRPVHVASVTHVGKEIIVDPTDMGEGLTAEMLGATEALEYKSQEDRLATLRMKIRAAGASSVAQESGVGLTTIKAFANQGRTPHESTIRKLETAWSKIKH